MAKPAYLLSGIIALILLLLSLRARPVLSSLKVRHQKTFGDNPSVIIAPEVNEICAEVPVKFIATPSGIAGETPAYRWTLNGANAGTGPEFTLDNPKNGNVVICYMTLPSSPAPVMSNFLSLDVLPAIHISVSINISKPGPVCADKVATFLATPVNADASPLFQWKVNGVNRGTGTQLSAFSTAGLKDGDVVSCDMTSGGKCLIPQVAHSNQFTVTVVQPVYASINIISPKTSICQGDSILFTTSTVNAGAPKYEWRINGDTVRSNGDTLREFGSTFKAKGLQNGDKVTCILYSSITCADPVTSDPVTVTVNPVPVITFDNQYFINPGEGVTLVPHITTPVATYIWSPAIGLSDPTAANPVAHPDEITTYHLKVISTGGCGAEGEVRVLVQGLIKVNNAFTPNGDGIHDRWEIPALEAYTNCTVTVFNRYGQVVFSSRGYSVPWDGTSGGNPLPTGTYYYIIDPGTGGKSQKGTITILR